MATSAHDGTEVIKWDGYLEPYRAHFQQRYARYLELKRNISEHEGSLLDFAKPFAKRGFNFETVDGKTGWMYREWAPGAERISLMGDFNNWNRDEFILTPGEFGVHHIFLPDKPSGEPLVPHNTKVKIHVRTKSGQHFDRIPAWMTYCVQDKITNLYDGVMWNPPGGGYKFKNPRPPRPQALRIYEAHVGIATQEPKVGSYKEFHEVLRHAKNAGYNAVQLMAIMEHNYYASFGYHVTNFFAPSSRFGTPDELKELIDVAHGLGLTVLMDVVHAHASTNQDDGLSNLDGTDHLYFHGGARGHHSLWDSKLFNYGNWEVLRFLLANLRYWVESFQFDGFRFDGITSMLYVHHGIGYGFSGGYHEYFSELTDHESVAYLMLANDLIRQVYSDSITIAEDVSGMPTLCRPVSEGGVGFDYRLAMAIPDIWIKLLKEQKDEDWNIGNIAFTLTNRRWMEPVICYAESHDQALVGDKTLAFWLMDAEMYSHFSVMTEYTPVVQRGIALHKLIRAVTHGLGGEGWLAFMGNEFGHPEWLDFPREGNNWSFHYARRQWNLVRDDLLRYKHLFAFDKAINECEDRFKWLASAPGYVSRKHEGDKLLVFERAGVVFVFNFHPTQSFPDYRIGVETAGKYRMVLNSDEGKFGGFDRYDPSVDYFTFAEHWDGRQNSLLVYSVCRSMFVLARVD